tara:strand:+ start:435 stop:629 length:195 start_codon:yes stop_codon:yes gene_type:complete
MKTNTKERTNTQICVSFGQDEKELLTYLDEERKKEQSTRSGWFKNRIREKKLTPNSGIPMVSFY